MDIYIPNAINSENIFKSRKWFYLLTVLLAVSLVSYISDYSSIMSYSILTTSELSNFNEIRTIPTLSRKLQRGEKRSIEASILDGEIDDYGEDSANGKVPASHKKKHGDNQRSRIRKRKNGTRHDSQHHGPSGTVSISRDANGEIPPPWADIPMPTKSYYAGFSAPNDPVKWKIAQLQASRGEQVLLSKVLETIKSPFDYIHGSNSFKWVHQLAELHRAKKNNFLENLHFPREHKAPIVLLGYRDFDRKDHEGHMTGFHSMNPDEIFAPRSKFSIPRKIVGIGSMDENWGWLSTYFLNRTVPWALNLAKQPNPWSNDFVYCNEYMKSLFDDPNLVALFVNQHHNCSHPKVVSLPLGINDPREVWNSIQRAVDSSLKKDQLIFTAGSNYAFRSFIRSCIMKNMGTELVVNSRISTEAFRMKIVTSMMVLCMPGLGYDTYRFWETLGSGSVPVVERGFGMDRTFYRLPVLIVDDFAELNPLMLRQAYIEALYLTDSWEYERMTRQYWQRLIYEISETMSIEPLLAKHPVSAEDENFTRPLVPYDCEAIGGCGAGTKRTPKRYCAIDTSLMHPGYNWVWDHSIGDRMKR